MFPGASDLFRGSCVTQILAKELENDILVELSHEPLGLKGSELQWPTVDKEAFGVKRAGRSILVGSVRYV